MIFRDNCMTDKKDKINENYENLRKRHDLPKFEDLNNEFEVSSIKQLEKTDFMLRVIRRRITDKLAMFCNILQSLILPNTGSAINMFEIKLFDEDDRTNIEKLLAEMMFWERKSLLLDIKSEEKEEAEFLKTVWNEWPLFSVEMVKFAEKMSLGWRKEEKSDKTQYFG